MATKTRPARSTNRRSGPTRPRVGRLEWGLLAAMVVLGGILWWISTSDGSAPEGAAFTGGDFHSLVVDPTTPDTVYVGGHQAVSRSRDGGRTWERMEGLDDADAMGWGFTDTAVYVSGHPGLTVAAAGSDGFARSNDGLPDTIWAAGPGAGVIASTDGGATWQSRARDAGQPFFGRILTDDTGDLIAADTQVGPVRSRDGGRTWTSLGGPPSVWLTRTTDGTIIASGGPEGAVMLEPDSDRWRPLDTPDGVQLVEADPHTPGRLFAGAHDGAAVELWVSTDAGQTWTRP